MKKTDLQFTPDFVNGLTDEQVALLTKNGQTNKVKKTVGKSYLAIFASNIFTVFNLIGIIIFVLMVYCCSLPNMFFFVVILANTVIGIVQEIRSKRAIERLSLVSEPTAKVVRSGKEVTVKTYQVVKGDLIHFAVGNQICADCKVVGGEVEVNESMLTGESVSVKKQVGDLLYSGSYVVSGNCFACAEKVGKESYVESLTAKVKKTAPPRSEVLQSIKAIIKVLGVMIIPLGIATFFTSNEMKQLLAQGNVWSNYWNDYFVNWKNNWHGVFTGQTGTAFSLVQQQVNGAIASASGSMIGMIPSGMVLLLSISFAVAALKLASKKVLVRELPCIEMLARVDTLCLDKTGTITDGSMTVEKTVLLGSSDDATVKRLLATVVSATGDDNTTARAVRQFVSGVEPIKCNKTLAFSSERKYSACQTEDGKTVALGATEFLLDDVDENLKKTCNDYFAQGLRVLCLATSDKPIDGNEVSQMKAVALVILSDTVRSDASEIIGWFKRNSVEVKIISGDNPLAVSVIAGKVGVANAEKYLSLEGMSDSEVYDSATKYTVFGRVSPEQKAVLVRAMKDAGHTVAMTGDGVNDILAMRESDCAITVGSGTDAAKTSAHLVLSDDKFSSMPGVVAEGRQVVNNVQNSSTLFLMKTTMTFLTTVLLLFLPYSYPFQAMHLYAIEMGIIGIGSFLLAFKPNNRLISGKFIDNVLKRMIPSGIAVFGSVALTYAFGGLIGISQSPSQISTVAMLSMTATGLVALWMILLPMDRYNLFVGVVCSAVAFAMVFGYQWLLTGPLASVLNADGNTVFLAEISPLATWFVVANVAVCSEIVFVNKLISNLKAKRKKA